MNKATDSKNRGKVNELFLIMQEHFGNSMNLARIRLMSLWCLDAQKEGCFLLFIACLSCLIIDADTSKTLVPWLGIVESVSLNWSLMYATIQRMCPHAAKILIFN